MSRFIKRLFIFLILLTIGFGTWAFVYKEMEVQEVKELLAEWFSRVVPVESEEEASPVAPPPSKPTEQNEKSTKESYELQPLPVNPFAKIDGHARNVPASAEQDLQSLAAYLIEPTQTDLEKARSIFVWLTDNISYDDRAYNDGVYGDLSSEGVLHSRKAVCEGFSNLYLKLGKEMGLEIKKVVGYSKGYGFQQGRKISKTDHAWNVIKIGDYWKIFDATWGQGNGQNVNGKLKTVKKFDDYWFNVDAYEAIFSHLPENLNLAYVSPQIDLKIYNSFPTIDEEYFEIGFNGRQTYKNVYANHQLAFPDLYHVDTYIVSGRNWVFY